MTEPEPVPVQEPVSVELVAMPPTPPAVRLVALILGAALLLALGAITYLAATEHPTPDVLQNVAVGSLAALSALLVGNRR